jgi:gliding motility-associated-like protein
MDPANPVIDELTGYRVYGATSPIAAAWTPISSLVSTGTLSWAVDQSTAYYYVRAANTAGLSRPSIIRRLDPPEAYLVSPDGRTHYTLPVACADALAGTTADDAYLIEVSSNPAELVGRVVKSVVFMAWRGGVTAVPNFTFDCMGRLRLRYEKSSSGAVQLSGAETAAAAPEQLSVFWNNGTKWVQLYGVLDSLEQTVTVEAKYLGKYQLRAVERVGGFNFDTANLSNRMLTPNGDGKNDAVVFTFDNPRASEVKGRIFDLKGAEVATMVPGPVSNSLMWDGKAGGNVVPGGVYIYQLESEEKTFNGTVVVIK